MGGVLGGVKRREIENMHKEYSQYYLIREERNVVRWYISKSKDFDIRDALHLDEGEMQASLP